MQRAVQMLIMAGVGGCQVLASRLPACCPWRPAGTATSHGAHTT